MSRRLIAALLAALVLLGAALYLVIPGGTAAPLPGGARAGGPGGGLDGQVLTPVAPAPATVLLDSLGHRVDLTAYRGRAVLVTFLYTRCPDVCPLIAARLQAVRARLGAAARRLQLVAISVDPRGDTRRAANDFLRLHGLSGQMEYLLGSAAQLASVWKAWNVGSERDAGQPELVAHSALVYGIAASGALETVYDPPLDPVALAHDVPLLAAR